MMARTDIHLDAMLRHLGAAYYDSRHGKATRADVTRALDTVEEHLAEQGQGHPAGSRTTAAAFPAGPLVCPCVFFRVANSPILRRGVRSIGARWHAIR